MKFVRCLVDGTEKYGLVDDDKTAREIKGNIFDKYEVLKNKFSLSEVKFLTPSVPTKIVATGNNYLDHIKESGDPIPEQPLLFLKPPSSLIAHNENIVYPKASNLMHFEAELGVIIKNKIKNIDRKDAFKNVLGYTCFNDVSARDLQRKDGQWTRGKSFDTFAPTGPFVVTDLDPNNLAIKLRKNGETKQNSSTKNMLFKIDEIVSYVSQIMTLYPGDIIATGTPPGVGEFQVGDVIEVEIEGIGILRNGVSSM